MSAEADIADPLRGPHRQAMSDAQLKALFDQVSNWGRWGADDQRGALNHLGPAEVFAGAALVREGRTVSLSRDFPTRPGPDRRERRGTRLGAPAGLGYRDPRGV